MPEDLQRIEQIAQAGFAQLEAELINARERQLRSVVTDGRTGYDEIDHAYRLDCKYRLVFVRCHFSGGSGDAPLYLKLDSGRGPEYDTGLFTVSRAGTGHDVHLRFDSGAVSEPSPWTFQPDDFLYIWWDNPDQGNMTWGLEVGLVVAS